jgi:CheY-like chemotaxis protein
MTKTILLADDSVTIQKVVELTFMDEDYRVVAVGNGEEALARLPEAIPDLVIADVHMPGASGYEVCRRAKEQSPGVPVLLLVGTFEPFDEGQARASGADAHLKKPFDSQELLRLVDNLLARAAAAPPPAAAPAAPNPLEEDSTQELRQTGGGVRVVAPASAPLWPEEGGAGEAPASALPAGAVAATTPLPTIAPPAASEPPNGVVGRLSDEDVDRVARRVVEILSERIVREVAWEVIPDLAEVVIKDRLRELEAEVEQA